MLSRSVERDYVERGNKPLRLSLKQILKKTKKKYVGTAWDITSLISTSPGFLTLTKSIIV